MDGKLTEWGVLKLKGLKWKVIKLKEWNLEFCLNSFKVNIQNTFSNQTKILSNVVASPLFNTPWGHDKAARGPESNSKYSKAFGISAHTNTCS